MADDILRLEHIYKSYHVADGNLSILEDVSLSISSGEIVAIVGQSGSGKSTLLSIAALLLSKDRGKIFYNGVDSDTISKHDIEKMRNSYMGFVFQSSMLLEDFSALENVAFPLLIQGRNKADAYKRAEELLALVSLSDRLSHRPARLSGGEKQRVAIARALSASPSIIFADEPTGALDEASAQNVSKLLFDVVRKEGKGMLLVTHNKELAASCDKILSLKGCKVE